jgi:hypothetical protein
MNCRDAEPLLVEAARATLLGSNGPRSAGARTDSHRASDVAAALEHAASCSTCAERLREERSLTLALNTLTAAAAAQEPSGGCEATLLAAFRDERGREVHTRRWIFALSGAMAASLVLLLGTAVLLSHESGNLVRAISQQAEVQNIQEDIQKDEQPEKEEVTDFVAFYPGADASPVDSGALVRVRVPRSSLSSFGVPAAQGGLGREEEWVSADLLVAEDGSPMAIRFVRPVSRPTRD